MKVYKFGGASTATPERFKRVCEIITRKKEPLLVVASAIGKSTNHLEKVLALSEHDLREASRELDRLYDFHLDLAKEMLKEEEFEKFKVASDELKNKSLELLSENKGSNYSFLYDQLVSTGELLATRLFSLALESRGIRNTLLDARQILLSDRQYRQAGIDLQGSRERIRKHLSDVLHQGPVIVQGFIAGTPEGHTTTLGREGSDYSAALFAALAGAKEVSIWKDVPGVLNADPHHYPDAILFDHLHYDDALEISRLGAKVIHPKTIRPLREAGIPLRVRSFLDPESPGTRIGADPRMSPLPPIIVHYPEVLVLQTPQSEELKDHALIESLRASGNLIRKLGDGEECYYIFRKESHTWEELNNSAVRNPEFKVLQRKSFVLIKNGNAQIQNKIIENKKLELSLSRPEEGLTFLLLDEGDQ